MSKIGEQLKQMREEQGLTVLQLSRYSGVNRTSIYKIESGETSPSIHTLSALARGLGKDLKIKFEDIDGF